jgi:hypothetical protein
MKSYYLLAVVFLFLAAFGFEGLHLRSVRRAKDDR